ncbi:hypothetical protein R3P38DRAFT_2517849, partial [Favolaschia claudopus]
MKIVNTKVKAVTGPPQALVSRIEHLHTLLRNLPASIPENPPHSLYKFALDPERVKDTGYFSAVGHALEISFETHLLAIQGRPLLFVERGERLELLIKMLKSVIKKMTPSDRTCLQEAWIERLITGATNSGAQIPSKKRKNPPAITNDDNDPMPPAKKSCPPPHTVIVLDDDDAAASEAATSSPSRPTPTPATQSESSAGPAPGHTKVVGNPRQSTLHGFGWKKGTQEDTRAYWAKAKETGTERREAILEDKKRREENQKERERDLARLRQQRCRERKKAEKEEEEASSSKKPDVNTVLMQGADALAHTSAIPDVADISRQTTQPWRKQRTGTLGGAVRGPSTRVFWFTPFLWAIIEPTVRRCGWSAGRAVKELQRAHPMLFKGLNRGTIHKWIVKGEKRFTDNALRSIANRKSLGGTGRTGILMPHPAITEEIVGILKSLRVSGCVVNVEIARSLMIAIINKRKPLLLASFSCSEKYVRAFLDSTLNW